MKKPFTVIAIVLLSLIALLQLLRFILGWEVTVHGVSVPVWASGTGISVEPTKTQGKFKVTVAKDAVPGVYWLRAYNADGASGLRPFIVGMLPVRID